MTVEERFGVTVKQTYVLSQNSEVHLHLPLGHEAKTSVSMNVIDRRERTLPLYLRRSQTDGQLQISFNIYNERGNLLASVVQNHIIPELDQEGRYLVLDSDDEIGVMERATKNFLLKICRRPHSENSVGLVIHSLRLYSADGLLVELGQANHGGTDLA